MMGPLLILAVKTTLVLAIVLLVARLIPDVRVELRVILWRFAVMAVLLLAPLSAMLPDWDWSVLPAVTSGPSSVDRVAPSPAVVIDSSSAPAISPMQWLSVAVVAFWATGLLLALAGLTRALSGLLAWARRGRNALHPPVQGVADQLRRRFRMTRMPRVSWSEDVQAPMSWGLIRGQVLLPVRWQKVPSSMIQDALAHEFAHLHRRDWLWLIAARLGTALLWWNPLIHRVVRHLGDDTELACDGLAIRATASPASYARTLIAASERPGSQPPSVAALAMAESGSLRRRVQAVMAEPSRRFQMTQPHKFLFHSLVIALLVPVAACQISRAQPVDTVPVDGAAPGPASAPVVTDVAYPSASLSPASALAYGEAPGPAPVSAPRSAPTPEAPRSPLSAPEPAATPSATRATRATRAPSAASAPSAPSAASAPRAPRAPVAPVAPVRATAEMVLLAESKVFEQRAREQRREAERLTREAQRAQLAAERELARAAERKGREERDAVRHKARDEARAMARRERDLAREQRQQLALEREQLDREREVLEMLREKLTVERQALERQREELESLQSDNR